VLVSYLERHGGDGHDHGYGGVRCACDRACDHGGAHGERDHGAYGRGGDVHVHHDGDGGHDVGAGVLY